MKLFYKRDLERMAQRYRLDLASLERLTPTGADRRFTTGVQSPRLDGTRALFARAGGEVYLRADRRQRSW